MIYLGCMPISEITSKHTTNSINSNPFFMQLFMD